MYKSNIYVNVILYYVYMTSEMKRIVVLGGGTGGSIMINKLAHGLRDHLRDGKVSITVVNPSSRHYYQPAFLLIPVGIMDEREAYTSFNSLVPEGVRWVKTSANKIDIGDNRIVLDNGQSIEYDYLVVSTGAVLDPGRIKGLDRTSHFYSFKASIELKKALANFKGGKIVIGPSSIPYRCPPAPIEMTLILRDYFDRRGISDKVEITYFYPLPRVFPIERVSELLHSILDSKGIETSLMFNLDYVDVERRRLVSMEGEELEYDLAIVVPPHRGSDVIINSGLGDEDGWVDVDRYTLNVEGYENVYVIGDATNLPVSKAGSVADFQAEVVVKRIIDDIEGFEPTAKYNGKTMCFVLTGIGKATVLVFDYNNPPPVIPPSFLYYWLKLAYNKLYWSVTAKSILSGVVL